MENKKYSPMIQEYLKTKDEYKDCILFYRLGDFYEMFFEDAEIASKELELVLTSKACGKNEKAPMCGIPFHSADNYIYKIVSKGYKVAIAEQTADPSSVKGLLPREVVRVVTPGTLIDSNITSSKENNYLMAIYKTDGFNISWCDLSTGEFCESDINGELQNEKLLENLTRIQPNEIITNFEDEVKGISEYQKTHEHVLVSEVTEEGKYNNASGMLLWYLKNTQKQDITHLEPIRHVDDKTNMRLDKSSLRNLEILETFYDKSVNGSLFGVLDKCKTTMGSRRLKQWLIEPLVDKDSIDKRLDAVEVLKNDEISRNNIRNYLKNIYDIERLISRISLGTVNARDLLALKQSIYFLKDIKIELSNHDVKYLNELNQEINELDDVYKIIDNSILEEPSISVREGGMIKPGYSDELDKLHDEIKDSKEWIKNLEKNERNRTGIKNLKVGFNKVFGYYIEVTNSQLSSIPADYIRKQTLVGGERFFTNELKDTESILLNAQSTINETEYKIFCEVRNYIKRMTGVIQKTAIALSKLDVIADFSEVASKNEYVKPEITNNDEIIIKNGRHPVIEKTVEREFVPNDVKLNRTNESLIMITGPNMGGKSTYMRQLALIVLMAQAGCFVPADEAVIGICDRIYTRIGSGDNISMGQSTFFVEMSELAYILNTATDKSLIILDEIGRGTSTLDGLSIAWSVVEKLTKDENKVRTLFATHYHELTNLENKINCIKNLNVEVEEKEENIEFSYKVVDGASDKSFGIQVAKLAGVPEDVIEEAKKKLESLEESENSIIL